MIFVLKKITPKDIPSIDECGDVENILVRAERDVYPAEAGGVGLIIWEASRARQCVNRRWTIRFANGDQGMSYPSLRYMLEREISDGNFSFYQIEFK